MKLMLPLPDVVAPFKIRHTHHLFFIGSCFAENMATYFKDRKFITLKNPFGVLYNPISIAKSIEQITKQEKYNTEEFYLHDELYSSWAHHSKLSDTNATDLKIRLEKRNQEGFTFLKTTDIAFITLGTAWVYVHKETTEIVGNNHKAPNTFFNKRLLEHTEIMRALQSTISLLKEINPAVKIVLSVSPVRHAKQGLVENNRSKARLLEAIHAVCDLDKDLFYFPSYEIILDVLRDYRFFKTDLIHPNQLATDFLWSFTEEHVIDAQDREPIKKALELTSARRHKLMHPKTKAAQKFVVEQLRKMMELEKKYPYLDFEEEKKYFETL